MADTELRDFPSLFSLKGKVAVITGGSRGLGLHAASGILQAGASIVFISSRKKAACDEAAKALNALPNLAPGARAISAPADLSKFSGVEDLVKQVKETPGVKHVDILLANAGATWGEKLDTHPDSAIAKVFDLNVRSVFNTVRLFAPLMAHPGASIEDPSRIIITASVAGLGVGAIGEHGTYGYSASKAAAVSLARNLALELGPRHINVNAIAPGFFPSKMANGMIESAGGLDEVGRANPMGRLGKPEDMAGAVVYLTSRASAHVNASTLVVDGGAMWARGEVLSSGNKAKI